MSGPAPHEAFIERVHQAQISRRTWGQLRLVRLEDVLDQLRELDEAATSDCDVCELRCCTYDVNVSAGEVGAMIQAVRSLGHAVEDIVEDPPRPGSVVDSGRLFRIRRRRDGQCRLLDDDSRCSVHRDSGFDRKPLACQVYPAVPIVTPSGPRLGLRSGCSRPGRTVAPEALAALHATLGRAHVRWPDLAARLAPAEIVLTHDAEGPRAVDWATWAAWEATAVQLVRAASGGMAAIDAVIASLAAAFGLQLPPAGGGRVQSLVGALSGLAGDHGSPREAAILYALACEEPPAEPRRAEVGPLETALRSLEPLRFETALAGLGFLRLMIALVDRDDTPAPTPETTAGWYRRLRQPDVADALARSTIGLERCASATFL